MPIQQELPRELVFSVFCRLTINESPAFVVTTETYGLRLRVEHLHKSATAATQPTYHIRSTLHDVFFSVFTAFQCPYNVVLTSFTGRVPDCCVVPFVKNMLIFPIDQVKVVESNQMDG